MALRLPDDWVWDSWVVADGDDYHLFFLHAARSLIDPTLRHLRASIGHATSTDLRHWRLLPDALAPSAGPGWDDLATWTGCTVRGADGLWRMFYTGLSKGDGGLIQRIGVATSTDLTTWTRDDTTPLVEADARWYEKLDLASWHEEAWRDPFVFADPNGDGWHMLLAARAPQGPSDGRGVIGYARSADLVRWKVQPPLTSPAGFAHLEVPQSRTVDGQPLLVFSCDARHQSIERLTGPYNGAIWVVPGASHIGPWDFARARPVAHPSLYAGQLVLGRGGQWWLLGFRDIEDDRFVGAIVDPLPVRLSPEGLELIPALTPPY
jgi:beta-fructofuranosidase